MDDEPTRREQAAALAGESNALARERTREGADRTLMAWIRTSLSLIAFGLGIGKAVELLDAVFPTRARVLDARHSTLAVALGLIAIGVLSMLGAIIQYWLRLKALEQATYTYKPSLPLTGLVAGLLLVIGLLALAAMIIAII